MKQIFKAKKDNFWIYLVGSLILPIYIFYVTNDLSLELWHLTPAFIPFLIFIWAYFSTHYYIIDSNFYYQSIFFKGKIAIDKIKELQLNKTLWSGVKPALARKGVIIKFGFDEIYVAPINNQQLADALLKINPNIIVK